MSSSAHIIHLHVIVCFFLTGALAAIFGPGLGPIALENVSCSGTEQTLLQCSSDMTEGNSSQCLQHAGVVCERKWILETAFISNVAWLYIASIVMTR